MRRVSDGEQEAAQGRVNDHMPEGAGPAEPMWLCLCLPPRDHPSAPTWDTFGCQGLVSPQPECREAVLQGLGPTFL